MKRFLLASSVVALLATGAVIALQPATPMRAAEIRHYTHALYLYGAVTVPHDLAGTDHPQAALLARVAAGEALSKAESVAYRLIMQAVLADHQWLFGVLDNNIVFASNAGPGDPNNCGSQGIAGRHDLHAASALSNFEELETSLAALPEAGAFGRIRHANRALKSLTDLMVHLAPATHSVVLTDQPPLPKGANPKRAALFEAFRRAMADAAFAQINSPAEQAAITRAEAAYAALALEVQSTITAALSPLEQRIAGRWLSLQSVSPRLADPPQ